MKKVPNVVLRQLRIDENRSELQYQRQIKSQFLDLAVTVRFKANRVVGSKFAHLNSVLKFYASLG